MTDVSPGLVLILGALLVPLLRGSVRPVYMLALPVLAFVLGIQLAALLLFSFFAMGLVVLALLLAVVRPRAADGVHRFMYRTTRRLETRPGELARALHGLVEPVGHPGVVDQ